LRKAGAEVSQTIKDLVEAVTATLGHPLKS